MDTDTLNGIKSSLELRNIEIDIDGFLSEYLNMFPNYNLVMAGYNTFTIETKELELQIHLGYVDLFGTSCYKKTDSSSQP